MRGRVGVEVQVCVAVGVEVDDGCRVQLGLGVWVLVNVMLGVRVSVGLLRRTAAGASRFDVRTAGSGRLVRRIEPVIISPIITASSKNAGKNCSFKPGVLFITIQAVICKRLLRMIPLEASMAVGRTTTESRVSGG